MFHFSLMFDFNMHYQFTFQIKHGHSHFCQYYENTTSTTSLLARSVSSLSFFLNQSDEFKVTSHFCFNLQFPSKYGLLFTGFLALCICSLGIACLYCLSIFPESCLSCQFTRVIDSNPLSVIHVIHSPPQLSSLQVLSLA